MLLDAHVETPPRYLKDRRAIKRAIKHHSFGYTRHRPYKGIPRDPCHLNLKNFYLFPHLGDFICPTVKLLVPLIFPIFKIVSSLLLWPFTPSRFSSTRFCCLAPLPPFLFSFTFFSHLPLWFGFVQ